MEKLTDVVKELVLEYGISHDKIVKHVRSTVMDISKDLPKIGVLYNKCHGGFGLSKQFIEFVYDNRSDICEYSYKARTDYVQYIKPFGESYLAKYKAMRRMMMVYTYYNIKSYVSCAISTYYKGKQIQKYENQLGEFQACVDTPSFQGDIVLGGEDTDMYHMLQKRGFDIYGYTKESYERVCEELARRIEVNKTDKQKTVDDAKANIDDAQWCAIYNDLEPIVHQMIEESNTRYETLKKYKCFASALEEVGDCDPFIWSMLKDYKFDAYAMRYLRIKHQDYEAETMFPEGEEKVEFYDYLLTHSLVKLSEPMYQQLITDVGLVCASSKYCNLAICEVPQYVDWRIHEYDGLESVVFT